MSSHKLFSQEDIQEAHDQLFGIGLTKITKYEVNPYLVVISLLAITIAVGVFNTMQFHRAIARKTSLVTCALYKNDPDPAVSSQWAFHNAMISGDPLLIREFKNLDKNNDGIACNEYSK